MGAKTHLKGLVTFEGKAFAEDKDGVVYPINAQPLKY